MNKKKNSGIETLWILGLIFLCTGILAPIGVFLIIIAIVAGGVKSNSTINNVKYNISEEDNDTLDSDTSRNPDNYNAVLDDDVSQDYLHEHNGWNNNDGPIKYH